MVVDVDDQLQQLVCDVDCDQYGVECGDQQLWMLGWVVVVVQVMCYIYEVEYVQWYECDVEVDLLELECGFVEFFVQFEVECFWELVVEVCEIVEQYVVDDYVVEVCDQEQVVVQYEVCVGDCYYYVGYVVECECDYEVDCLQYGCCEFDLVVVYCEQLVEYFYVGWNCDDYCYDFEECVYVCV